MSLFDSFAHIVRENENLAPYTRLNIGGDAEYFAEPTNQDELVGIVKLCHENKLGIRLIGSGSNMLVSDKGVSGVVMHLGAPAFGQIEVTDNGLIAGGGAKLSQFVSTAVREGFAGPEQMVGLPGTIGGALHSNIADHGVEFGNWVRSAEVLTRTGEIEQRTAESMSFSYRQSSLNELVILRATFEFEKESAEELTKAMQKLWITRRANHVAPEQRSAYIFEDIGGELATDILQQAGVAGTSVGKASLSEHDLNMLVVEAGADSSQVLELIQQLKQTVLEKTEIELQTAIQLW